jgi:uncharacterized membrane protein (DUF2068 family)
MTGQSRPSPGIVAAAIVALIGSGFALLMGLLEIGMTFVRWPVSDSEVSLPFLKYSFLLVALMAFGFGAWGIASAVGLLRLREWARISTIVFSAIFLLFAIFPMLMLLMIPPLPLESTKLAQGTSSEEITHLIRIGMAAVYLIPAAVAVWWLIFFNRGAVKAQFVARSVLASFPESPANVPAVPLIPAEAGPARPVSINIIGWYMIVAGGLMLPFPLLMPMPVGFLGWVLTGRRASLLFLTYGVIHLGLGYGLLKLKPLSRTLTIWYFLWTVANSLAQALLPGREVRLKATLDSMAASLGAPQSQLAWYIHFARFGLWAGNAFAVLVAALIIWLLAREKQAFETARV